jgi:hypothetical protein
MFQDSLTCAWQRPAYSAGATRKEPTRQVTDRARINRPISSAEIEVIRATLERAPSAPEFSALGQHLENLRAINRCVCGCDSVDFAEHDPARLPMPIADGTGITAQGGTVGVIVWGRADSVTGLEVYDLGAGENDLRLPTPDSIRPFSESGT